MRLAPYSCTRVTLSFLLLAACGGDPGTSATDSASASSSGASSSSSASTGEPITTGTGEPGPTTSGASESVSGSSTGSSTTDASTSTGPVATSTGDADSTSTGAAASESSSTSDAESTSTTSDDTTGAIMDCATLKQAFQAEALEIRSCKQPADCGVELPMTSCGCTNNWVARKDADTKPFYDLLALGEELECELILAGTCDCPAADGFTCKQDICTWNYL